MHTEMEDKHKDLLEVHRSIFLQSVDVDKLLPALQCGLSPILDLSDVSEISSQKTRESKVERLLSILPSKGPQAFQKLCKALESTYPHLLTVMFLGRNQAAVFGDSCLKSPSSDSEDDCLQPRQDKTGDPACHNVTPSLYQPRHVTPLEYDQHSNIKALRAELTAVITDREAVRDELHKVHNKLEQYKTMALHSDSRKHRDYDRLKEQFEDAMRQLQDLNQKYNHNLEKCDRAVRDANCYKKKCEQLEHNERGLRSQNSEALSERKRLEQEVCDLQKLREDDKQEMAELLQRQRQAINESGSNEVINKMYEHALDKYEETRKECDGLRKRYADLNVKLEVMQEENAQLVKQSEKTSHDYSLLQQHCKGVIHQCSELSREKQSLKEEIDKLKKQLRQAMSVEHDLRQMKEERNAAVSEYKVIMSERDAVLKEIDQLQDRLSDSMKKSQTHEIEKKTLQNELEHLRCELSSVIIERDHAVKEINNLRESYGDAVSEKEDIQKQRDEFCKDFEMLIHERDTARRERLEAMEQRDKILLERSQQDKAEEEHTCKESECLKKEVERIQQELNEALRESAELKDQREWAFKERERTLLERDAWRKASDKLRQERDLKVNELTEALRDSDDLKRLKNEASKELKEYKEKYEVMIEKEVRKQQLNSVGHNHSRDSAIDADLQEWETETLQFDLGGRDDVELGFDLVGGKDDQQFPSDSSFFVSHVNKGSVADGKLKVGDQLLTVNNVDVTCVDKNSVLQAIRTGDHVISMVVRRRKTCARVTHNVNLNVSVDKDVGILVDQGLYISRISQGSVAAREANLAVGDRIISINGNSVENMTPKEAIKLIGDCSDNLVLHISKFLPTSSSPPPHLVNSFDNSSSGNLLAGVTDDKPGSRAPLRARPWANETDSSKSSFKALVSSGSQTDTSLDSPTPRKKHGRSQEIVLEPKSRYEILLDKIKNVPQYIERKIKHKSTDRMKDIEDDAKQHFNKCQKPMNNSVEDALTKLDHAIEIHYSQTDNVACPPVRERSRDETGSTWPRYRSPAVEVANGGTIMVAGQKRKSRPGLPDMNSPGQYELSDEYSRARVPPVPPKRDNSSFAASIRHSPQNSDISNKLSVFSPAGTQQLEATNIDGKQDSDSVKPSGTSTPSSGYYTSYDKSFSADSSVSTIDHHSQHSTASTPDPTSDMSIVSQKDMEIVSKYYQRPHPRSRRPKSGGPRSRQANARAGTPGVQKPISLEVESHAAHMYPSSSRTLPTSHLSPRDPNKPFQAPSQHTYSVRSPVSHYSSTLPHGHMATGGSSRCYQSHSQPVSPSGQSPAPLTSQHYSPNGGLAQSAFAPRPLMHNPSIPEMDTDCTPYHLKKASRPYSATPSPSFHSTSTIDRATPTPSEEFPYNQFKPHDRSSYRSIVDGTATFPSCKPGFHQNDRIHMKSSYSSVDRGSLSDCTGGLSPFGAEHSSSNSIPKAITKPRKPQLGETRNITIQKSDEMDQLGLQIQASQCGGIFVSSVVEGSWADAHGLQIGDQLLEVCGINMRAADYTAAASVLRQCGGTVTMLVQYNPNKYRGLATPSPSVEMSTQSYSSADPSHMDTLSSGSGTPTNSPRKPVSTNYQNPHKPRFVFLTRSSSNLGISLVGGNAVGIFVNSVQPDSPAFGSDGLRCGDRILEMNGVDLREATAEQAVIELAKAAETSQTSILAQYNINKYKKIVDQPGDSFYVRAMFDRISDEDGELSFHKDDILYVDNTLYEGKVGVWRAWRLDGDGNKVQSGTVHSKARLEEDSVTIRRSISETLQDDDLNKSSSRRLLTSSRRSSFFRRRKHQRNNSKDSRDFTSFSDMSINSDSIPVLDDGALATYCKVDKLHEMLSRPVLIIGPLSEALIKKISSESPDKYVLCEPDLTEESLAVVEKKLSEGQIIDYQERENVYDCLSLASVRAVIDNNRHCMLQASPAAVDRLHSHKIHPIVLFIKYKSPKQIREVKDTFFMKEKVGTKHAKDLFDTYQKVEAEYRHLFSAVIHGGNLAFMCRHIKTNIDNEQKKMVWAPSGTL